MATLKHFDKLAFIDEAKQAGANENFARLIASKLEEVETFRNEEIATKYGIQDIKATMKDLELRLIKWQIGVAGVIVTSNIASVFTLIKLAL